MSSLKLSTENWLFGLALSLLFSIIFLTGFNGLYGQDSHEYYRYSEILMEYLKGDGPNENFYWTVLYPLTGTLIGFIIGHSPFNLQLISILAFSFSLVLLYKTVKTKTSDSFLIAFLVIGFLLSPSPLKMAMLVMSDTLAAFFVVSSIFLFKIFLKRPHTWSLSLLAASILLATYCRYQMGVLLLPMALYALVIAIQTRLYKGILASLVVLIICSLPEWLLSPSLQDNISSNYFLSAWSFKNMWSSSFLSIDGTLNYSLPNIIFNSSIFWHPSFMLVLFMSIFWLKKSDFTRFEVTLLIGLVIYILLLSGLPFQNNRMLIPAYPIALVVLYKPFRRGMDWLWSKSNKLALAGLTGFLLLQVAFTVYLSRIFIQRNQLEQDVSAYLEMLPANRYYAFDLDVSMNTYLPDKEIKNLLKETYEFTGGDLIIFNQTEFDRLWSRSRIADNLQLIQLQFSMETVHNFGQGWALFELKKRE